MTEEYSEIFFGPHRTQQVYKTGTGQLLVNVHPVDENCIHYGCVIHQPSDHRMRDWPTHFRSDRELMERMCPHRIGHPDPDQLAFLARTQGKQVAEAEGVHGCDGCCRGEGPEDKLLRFP